MYQAVIIWYDVSDMKIDDTRSCCACNNQCKFEDFNVGSITGLLHAHTARYLRHVRNPFRRLMIERQFIPARALSLSLSLSYTKNFILAILM